ncbi:MAG: DUF7662 domain-containing protein, partial [Caulobacteraceae bacterium]
MSKYEPLTRFLRGRAEPETRMSFAEVEHALGFALPPSARAHAPWWSNDGSGGHSQARAWLKASRKTAAVDLANGEVTFVRTGSPRGERHAIVLEELEPAAAKLVRDYAEQAGGDYAAAIARALQEAAIARRRRLLERIRATASPVPLGMPD